MKVREDEFKKLMSMTSLVLSETGDVFRDAGYAVDNFISDPKTFPRFPIANALSAIKGAMEETLGAIGILEEVANKWPIEIVPPPEAQIEAPPRHRPVNEQQEAKPKPPTPPVESPPPPKKSPVAQALENIRADEEAERAEAPQPVDGEYPLHEFVPKT